MGIMKRCETCLGMGYKGRWRNTARGRVWKLETCRRCGGAGQVQENPQHKATK